MQEHYLDLAKLSYCLPALCALSVLQPNPGKKKRRNSGWGKGSGTGWDNVSQETHSTPWNKCPLDLNLEHFQPRQIKPFQVRQWKRPARFPKSVAKRLLKKNWEAWIQPGLCNGFTAPPHPTLSPQPLSGSGVLAHKAESCYTDRCLLTITPHGRVIWPRDTWGKIRVFIDLMLWCMPGSYFKLVTVNY